MRKLYFIVCCITSALCGYAQSCEVDGQYFSTFVDIQLSLNDNDCNSCHSGTSPASNWQYSDYSSLISSGDCGQPTVTHGNASQSYLYAILSSADIACGESAAYHKVSKNDLDRLEIWINQGAPEYCIPLYPDIRQIFMDNNCQSCHYASSGEWEFGTYLDMVGYWDDGNCDEVETVILGDAYSSLLYDKINNDGTVACGAAMPLDGQATQLSQEEIAKVRDWINGGALESSATLPVVLSNFTTEEVKEMTVTLKWSTESEIGTEKFIIERGQTGRDFAPIKEVLATGSSNTSEDYQYIDADPDVGENYYRLKILDLDGSFTYSNIRVLRLENVEAELSVSPNPAMSSERLKVTWYPKAGQEQAYLNIINSTGGNLHRKIIFVGTNYVRLPALIEGVYYIMIEDYFGGILLERVVIIN